MKSIFRMVCGCIVIILSSCGGEGSGEQPPPPEPNPSNDLPLKVTGTLPVNGEPCVDYEEVASDDTKVLIDFTWNEAEFADSYELVVLEGSTEVFNNTYSNLEVQVELQRGKTYTWSVTSINQFGETAGNTNSFTTPGIPEGNYAPYAAEINVEFNINTMEISISWLGSDEDGDSLVYDVQVLENNSLLLEEVDYSTESLQPIQFTAEETYFIQVVSKDTNGNFSISNTDIKAPN